MSLMKNKIENRAIRRKLEDDGEVVGGQQLVPLYSSSKSSPKMLQRWLKGGCTAARVYGMMMAGFCDNRVLVWWLELSWTWLR